MQSLLSHCACHDVFYLGYVSNPRKLLNFLKVID